MQNSNLAIYKTALETELRVSCRTFEMCKSAFDVCGGAPKNCFQF